MTSLRRSFYAREALVVARALLGQILVHEHEGEVVAGRIVETEAYGATDPGSHAARGRTPRNAPMFEDPGHAYVYFTYGMHFMLNAVTDRPGSPGAVLLRAVEPLDGLEHMRARRGAVSDRDLARGPGRLAHAFAIGRAHNRADLTGAPLTIAAGRGLADPDVVATPRIGLGANQDGRAWRFVERSSRFASGTAALNAGVARG